MTKQEARAHARRLSLPNWDKPDSQELCFVPDRDVRGFIGRQRSSAGVPGPILSADGRLLGRHEGIEGFTVGQRRGLRVSADQPLYVLRVLPDQAAVVVGTEAELQTEELHADAARWLVPRPAEAFEADVRIRHRHRAAKATVTPTPGGFRVRFAAPQRAVAPGQAAVLYQGDQVLGGGFISDAGRQTPASACERSEPRERVGPG
jgi:tRNA-specific 2-thiouridylase